MNQTSTTVVASTSLKLELVSEVRELVNNVLGHSDIQDDTDLIETGTLDSLALVSLIMELETAFDLTVSYDDLEIEAFRSIHSISTFVLSSKKN